MPNSRKYNDWSCVVDLPNDCPFSLRDFLAGGLSALAESKVFDYWAIVHDRDILPNGELKTEHIHLVVSLRDPLDHDDTLLWLAGGFCAPLNCVSVKRCKFLAGAVRYLTHKDDEGKVQYEDFEVSTNAPYRYNDLVACILSPKAIYSYLVSGGNPVGLILLNGRAWWNGNRNLVNDMWRYLQKVGPLEKKGGG